MAIWKYPPVQRATVDLTSSIAIGKESRCTSSSTKTPSPGAIPAATQPSQYASRLCRGRGRDIKTTTMTRRVGSVATHSASASTVPHIS
jgi:hypothetical protein